MMTGTPLQLTVSIVLYESKATEIKGLISSLLDTSLNIKVFLVDNSSTDRLKRLATDKRVTYIFNNKNIGYGRGHNIGIFESIKSGSPYHLVVNPDVEMEGEILEKMYNFMEEHPDAGCVVPNVLYPDGNKQYLNKLYPTPFDLMMRRFLPEKLSKTFPRFDKYELKHLDNVTRQVPIASGCFLFCRNLVLKEIGGFDSRYFMYLEDTDMCRRINEVSKVIFWPEIEVIHAYAKGSYSNPRLLFYHISSAIKYFNKWGWLFDAERRRINRQFK